MGRRGPAPTPTEVKIHLGETRPSRVNQREPQPRGVDPRMPRDLSKEARAVWRRVMAEMPSGVILAADTDVLRCYCEAVVRYVAAQRMLAISGPLMQRRGELVKSPLHQVVRDASDLIRLYARELGLSPAARAGLQMDLSSSPASMLDEIGPSPRERFRVVGGSDGD